MQIVFTFYIIEKRIMYNKYIIYVLVYVNVNLHFYLIYEKYILKIFQFLVSKFEVCLKD